MGETSLTAWLVVAAFVVLILVPGALVVFALGPLWWLVAGLVVATAVVYRTSTRDADGTTESPRPTKTNCVHCGARIEADAHLCSYCGESVEE